LLGNLLSCGFCLGHWLAMGAVLLTDVRVHIGGSAVDAVTTWLVLTWFAGVQWIVVCLLMQRAGK